MLIFFKRDECKIPLKEIDSLLGDIFSFGHVKEMSYDN